MTDKHDVLRFVVFAECDMWIAQGLEHDICAQGPDLNTLRERLLDTLDAERSFALADGKIPFDDIPPAPDHFFKMWDERSSFSSPERLHGEDDGRVELALCA